MQVPVRTMVVNQVVGSQATEQFLAMRRRDQQRALELLRTLPALRWAPACSAAFALLPGSHCRPSCVLQL